MKAKFLVFDGIDGSGHSTLTQKIAAYFKSKGHDVVVTQEPTNDSASGKKSREIMRSKNRHDPLELQKLMIEDRALHVQQILKWLEEGKIVVCDRYIYASLAYGAADGIDKKILTDLNSEFPRPDIAFILDVDPAIGLKRIIQREGDEELDIFEKQDFLKKVRQEFISIVQSGDYPETILIDAAGSVEKVEEEVKAILNSKH